jgi:hypothetical protein
VKTKNKLKSLNKFFPPSSLAADVTHNKRREKNQNHKIFRHEGRSFPAYKNFKPAHDFLSGPFPRRLPAK